MFERFRGGRFGREGEKARMAEEVADPSDAYVRRAREELSRAEEMSDAEFEAARGRVERDFLRKLVRTASRLNRDVAVRLLTGYFALRDPGVPRAAKAGFALVLLYFINPFDLVPDVTPVIGYLDDAGVMAAAWAYLAGHVTEAHRTQAEEYLART